MSSEMQNQNAADMVLDLRIQLFAVNSSSYFPSSVAIAVAAAALIEWENSSLTISWHGIFLKWFNGVVFCTQQPRKMKREKEMEEWKMKKIGEKRDP